MNVNKSKYTYYYRPAYHSLDFLIEFVVGPEQVSFLGDLLYALQSINVKEKSESDLWMNDEIHIDYTSSIGAFTYTKDNYDCAFIMGAHNQKVIKRIDKLLAKDPAFERLKFDISKF